MVELDMPYGRSFRTVLGHFPTGVAVITGVDRGSPAGLTIQSFCSLSLDPALILVCPSRQSASWPSIRRAGQLCVNLLADSQEQLARVFATSGANKFAGTEWTPTQGTGSPILAGCLGWIDCKINSEVSAGDHFIVVCQVLDFKARTDLRPLVFYKSKFLRLDQD
jgi:3-hydroxy-9,10-secoandrosta-1,3,5(10)-triene-9,17-dione monooxygenase reductase component